VSDPARSLRSTTVDLIDVIALSKALVPRLTAVAVIGALVLAPSATGRLFNTVVSQRAVAITGELRRGLAPTVDRLDGLGSERRTEGRRRDG
jgi:hypothetical protein